MILKCYLDYYGSHSGKTLKYITDGKYKDMLVLCIKKLPDLYCGRYLVDVSLQSRSMESRVAGNMPGYMPISGSDFLDGLNIIDEIYEDSKTNLEMKTR